MFYTRPTLAPLEIDLREIGGGGSLPAQFYGRTAEGRPIYIRYRGGRFSVSTGEVGDDDASTILLDAVIGPSLHGDMLLEQACDLAGLTVCGERLVLSDDKRRAAAEEAPILDWSGRTTYWVRDLAVTEEATRYYVETLARKIGEPVFFKVARERGGRQYRLLPEYESGLIGFGPTQGRLQELLSRDHVKIAEMEAAFAHVLKFDGHWKDEPYTPFDYTRRFGRPITIADGRLRGRMATEFATGDASGRAFVQAIVETADAQFSNHFELVDISSAAVVRTIDYPAWYSLDLLSWAQAAPDRYLYFYHDGPHDFSPHLGMRPAART